MILLKSALASILVVVGACDRAAEGRTSDPTPSTAVAAHPATHPIATQSEAIPAASADPNPPARVSVKPRAGRTGEPAKTVYVCPMHPEVVSDAPGLCPKCNMKLEPKPTGSEVRRAEPRSERPSWP